MNCDVPAIGRTFYSSILIGSQNSDAVGAESIQSLAMRMPKYIVAAAGNNAHHWPYCREPLIGTRITRAVMAALQHI
jgi:hypothetical protein